MRRWISSSRVLRTEKVWAERWNPYLCGDQVRDICVLCLCQLFDGILNLRYKIPVPLGIMWATILLSFLDALSETGTCGSRSIHSRISVVRRRFPGDTVKDVLGVLSKHDECTWVRFLAPDVGSQPQLMTTNLGTQEPARLTNTPLSVMAHRVHKLLFWAVSLLLSSSVFGYEVPIFDTDYSRQICSGMWSGQNTFINGMHVHQLGSTC